MTVIVTIPHCGTKLTNTVEKKMLKVIDGIPRDEIILDQSDIGATAVFDTTGMEWVNQLKGEYSRLVVDLNRNFNEAIYFKDLEGRDLYPAGFTLTPGDQLERQEIWDEYHRRVNHIYNFDRKIIFMDVHTMKYTPQRPDICIGTNGGESCDDDLLKFLHSSIMELYKNANGNVGDLTIGIDTPFRGDKYIIPEYCNPKRQKNGFLLEFNRRLFTDYEGALDAGKIEYMNRKFRDLTKRVVEYMPGQRRYLF